LEDDHNARYCANDTLRTLRTLAQRADVTIFTEAVGDGIDTDTQQVEPVIILQGSGTADAVRTFGDHAATYARTALRQRAVGWFATEEDTYRTV
jgi:hypothetical protein